MIRIPRPGFAWRPARHVVYHVVAIVLFAGLLLWHIASRPAGASPAEMAARKTSNLTALGSNPFFAPWRLMQDLFLHINSHSLLSARLPSVILGLMAVAAFYYLASVWFGRPLGFLSAVLLGTTPFFILLSRNGTADAMYLFLAVLVAAYVYFIRQFEDHPKLTFALLLASVLVCLYIPGFIWLLLFGAILKWRTLRDLKMPSVYYYVGGTLLLLFLIPLVLEFIQTPVLAKTEFFIPAHFAGVVEILKDWGWMLLSLPAQARTHTNLMIDRLPIFDVAQSGLALFGGYIMWARLRRQFYMLVSLVLLISLAASLNNNYNLLGAVLVVLSIAVAMGLRFLFVEWLHVFPRNPIPRYFAIALMASVVIIHVIYGVRYGLNAWPATVATQHLYVLKLK